VRLWGAGGRTRSFLTLTQNRKLRAHQAVLLDFSLVSLLPLVAKSKVSPQKDQVKSQVCVIPEAFPNFWWKFPMEQPPLLMNKVLPHLMKVSLTFLIMKDICVSKF
jgi:hypothetical protein